MSKKSKFGLGLLVGAAAGYAASLFVSNSTKKRHKDSLEATTQKALDKFLSADDQAKLKKHFAQKAEEVKPHLDLARDKISQAITASQYTLETMDKSKYEKLVDNVIKDLKTGKDIDGKVLTQLQAYLKADFSIFKAYQGKAKPKKSSKVKTKK